ncbi:jouberin-like [Stegodyphus dumicola]|uniref:jouberin-like n=1 Tax=Stegodyphus dumicola TaxID=202533 RepID=UPI0015ABFA5F|nr:jouberin-like [Stegodyphus dumicola]
MPSFNDSIGLWVACGAKRKEVGTTKADHLTEGNTDIAVHAQDAFQSMSVMDNEKEIKWSRKKGELCKIPTKVSVSLETVNVCQILKFSNFGRILATGSGNLNQFYLSVYEIPSGKLLLRKLAHTQVIYDLDWSQKDSFILSASGDYSVKMWNTKSWSTVNSFIHPSFVYSAKFHPSEENILATACFDHVIRIWAFKQSTELLKELEAHNHSINTLCWNPDGKKLFSADDSGQVKVWKIPQKGNYLMSNGNDAYTLEKELSLPEIKGISINKIVPGVAKAILYLLCSDYIVRQVDLSNGSIIFRYESAIKHQAPLCGCCSPCGSLLFACNGDGRVVVWNLNTHASSFVPVNAGCFSCIDYHPYEHMMAISSWEDSIPLYLYVNDEVSETNVNEKMIVHIEDSRCKETVNDYFSGAPHMEKNKLLRSANATKDCEIVPGVKMLNFRSGVKKNYGKQNPKLSFESSKSDENFAKSSTDATESSSSDIFMDHPKKSDKSDSLTAVVTKSGQFDVINVPADFKKSDTSDNRSQDSNGQSSAVPKSSKRSLRRKKLKELYF